MTGCLIGKVNKDNTVTAILVYKDGFISEGAGEILNKFYRDETDVDKLISYGSTRELLPPNELDTDKYLWDGSQRTYINGDRAVEEANKVYNYFFIGGKWYCFFKGLNAEFIIDLDTGETNKGDKINLSEY